MRFLPVLVLLPACTTLDAEMSGTYAIFLAADTSDNIDRLERDGSHIADKAADLKMTPIDCRDLSTLDEEELAITRLAGVDYPAECCSAGDGEDCEQIPATYFTWLNQFSYYKLEESFSVDGAVAPWRTEAVITSEGDLQLTAHIDMPGFGDFRFGWVIDPDFQPTECVANAEGGASLENIDGDWLAGWSEGADGGVWNLNASAYQINPSNQGEYWYIPQEWAAGTSFARFEDEEFYARATDYQDAAGYPLYFPAYPDFGGAPGSLPQLGTYGGWVGAIDEYLNEGEDGVGNTDLSGLAKSKFPLEFEIEDNAWRADSTPDSASGFHDWVGVSSSFVRIDNKDAIQVDNETPVTGSFQIFLEGLAAPSKVIVSGSFTLTNIREDVWGYGPPLADQKREENGTPECGDERLTTAD